jgi:hypothetical protein
MWILRRNLKFCWSFWMQFAKKLPGPLARGVLLHHGNARSHTARATQERIQELQWEPLEHLPYSPDLTTSDVHLFGLLKSHFSLMTKRLKRMCGNGWDNSQKTSMLLVSTTWHSDGTSVSILVEDMSGNKCFPGFEYHTFYFLYSFVTYLLTSSYVWKTVTNQNWLMRKLCGS